MRMSWDKKFLATTKKILSKFCRDEVKQALQEISKAAGQEISENKLRHAFDLHGLSPFRSHMKESEYIPHPVEKLEAREETNRDKKQLAQMTEELRQMRARVSFLDDVSQFRAPPKIMEREKKSGMREMTAVVLASDWHVEEPVRPESVAYRNEYNLDIADARIKRFFQGIIWNIEHQRASKKIAITDLVLWLGGDLMTGYIHPELIESNELSPTETILWLIPRLRDGIYTLLKTLDLAHIEIPCSFGNHGRSTDKPRVSTGYSNSFEWLMYHCIAAEFQNEKRVHFEITASSHQYVQVYDKTLHFHHGDDLKYMGGVGGLAIPLLKAVPAWDMLRKADVHNIGHFHQFSDFGRAVVNGSMIGYGPYSQRIRATFEVPTQAMYYMDKTRGKCMVTALWLDDESHRELYAAAANGLKPQGESTKPVMSNSKQEL